MRFHGPSTGEVPATTEPLILQETLRVAPLSPVPPAPPPLPPRPRPRSTEPVRPVGRPDLLPPREAEAAVPPQTYVSFMTSLLVHLVLILITSLIYTAIYTESRPPTLHVTQSVVEPPEVLETPKLAVQLDPQPPAFEAESFAAPVSFELPAPDVPLDPAAVLGAATGASPPPADGPAASLGPLDSSSFTGMVEYARENGLDIVLAFDSTGSMAGEIEAVKSRILQIGSTLLRKIPSARVGVVTYRDYGDDYMGLTLPLTDNVRDVERFVRSIYAGGGGDTPEAVDYGLKLAIQQNRFRPRARKVVLLFGDAPPHGEDIGACIELAGAFHRYQQGVVSTVTCRSPVPLPPFERIARAGGGEALIVNRPDLMMQELVVLIFGEKHRDEALEFFELDRPFGRGRR